jgi:hypothetical protein
LVVTRHPWSVGAPADVTGTFPAELVEDPAPTVAQAVANSRVPMIIADLAEGVGPPRDERIVSFVIRRHR